MLKAIGDHGTVGMESFCIPVRRQTIWFSASKIFCKESKNIVEAQLALASSILETTENKASSVSGRRKCLVWETVFC